MTKAWKLGGFALVLALGLTACEGDSDQPIDSNGQSPTQESDAGTHDGRCDFESDGFEALEIGGVNAVGLHVLPYSNGQENSFDQQDPTSGAADDVLLLGMSYNDFPGPNILDSYIEQSDDLELTGPAEQAEEVYEEAAWQLENDHGMYDIDDEHQLREFLDDFAELTEEQEAALESLSVDALSAVSLWHHSDDGQSCELVGENLEVQDAMAHVGFSPTEGPSPLYYSWLVEVPGGVPSFVGEDMTVTARDTPFGDIMAPIQWEYDSPDIHSDHAGVLWGYAYRDRN